MEPYEFLKLPNLEEDDITEITNGTMSVRVKAYKTDPSGKGHTFIVTPKPNPKLCAVTRMRNCMKLTTTTTKKVNRLFRSISKNGKKSDIPIGVNKIGTMPKTTVKFLKLPDADTFTGHSFRRTSATILSESGIGLVGLKQHGRWKSTNVAERYVNNTNSSKTSVSNMIQNIDSITKTTSGKAEIFHNCSFANCTINILPQ